MVHEHGIAGHKFISVARSLLVVARPSTSAMIANCAWQIRIPAASDIGHRDEPQPRIAIRETDSHLSVLSTQTSSTIDRTDPPLHFEHSLQ